MGASAGALAAGALFDATGGYTSTMHICSLMSLTAALAALTIPNEPLLRNRGGQQSKGGAASNTPAEPNAPAYMNSTVEVDSVQITPVDATAEPATVHAYNIERSSNMSR